MDYKEIKRRDAEFLKKHRDESVGNLNTQPSHSGVGIKLLIVILFIVAVTLGIVICKSFIIKNAQKSEVIAEQQTGQQTTESTSPIEAPITASPIAAATEKPSNRGTWSKIPDSVRAEMIGKSYPKDGNARISIDSLAYLTIPYVNFKNERMTDGHLVVAADVADEVLDIFEELYNIGYPIEKMQLIDKYNADDWTSIDDNNTSAFNYRVSTDGSNRLSNHALGIAIDINPQMNPYVDGSGTGSHVNAKEYWSRNVSLWSDATAKKAYIGTDTSIYKIFQAHGWTWGGNWSSYRDYQHFEKVNR